MDIIINAQQPIASFEQAIGDTRVKSITFQKDSLTPERIALLERMLHRRNLFLNLAKSKGISLFERAFTKTILWGHSKAHGYTVDATSSYAFQINIVDNSIDDAAAVALAKAFSQTMPKHTQLNFVNCHFKQNPHFDFVHKIMDIAELNFSESVLSASPEFIYRLLFGDVSKLKLARTGLTDEIAQKIEQRLKKNTHLTEIDLSDNPISPAILANIEQHIKDNNAIKTLAKTNITKQNNQWKLILENNHIDDELISQVVKMIHSWNYRFEEIVFPALTVFTEKQATMLADAIRANDRMTSISFAKFDAHGDKKLHLPLIINRTIKKIMGGHLFASVIPHSGIIFAIAGIALGLSAANFLIQSIPLLSHIETIVNVGSALMGIFIGMLPSVIYNYRFQEKLDKLTTHDFARWDANDKADFERGVDCQKSYMPYFHPRAYTPAAYLGATLPIDTTKEFREFTSAPKAQAPKPGM